MMRNVHQSLVIQLPVFLFFLLTSAVLAASSPPTGFNVSLSVPAGKSRTIPVSDPPGYRIKTIVIDAGHGGKDPGCLGANSREKHIALSIALSFAEQLRARFPDLRVILTRDDDTFVPLDERAAIANRAQADLFVSIHCNYMPGSQATDGSETYVMGLHTAQHNLDVAKRENEAILLEEDYEKKYDYDPNSSEGHILLSLYQNVHLDQSILFASFAEQKMNEITGRRTRGVKQAGFVVLKETTMPSVLVETGFLSSPTEEANLLSAEGQRSTAEALVAAFAEYREFVESGSVATVDSAPVAMVSGPQSAITAPAPAAETPSAAAPADPPAPASGQFQWTARSPDAPSAAQPANRVVNRTEDRSSIPTAPRSVIPVPSEREAAPAHVPRTALVPAPSLRPSAPASEARTHTPPSTTEEPEPPYPQDDIAIAPTAYTPPARRGAAPPAAPVSYDAPPARPAEPTELERELVFAVQLAASRSMLDTKRGYWTAIPEYLVEIDEEDGFYKYRVRGLPTYDEAVATLAKLRGRGFPDAFLIAHRDRQKLNQQQIKELLGR
jgi:N-acetylmuramoyl-L-alanine amidase